MESHQPSSADWDVALVAIKTVDDLDDDRFREQVKQLVRVLQDEGRDAHRSADRLEGLSAFAAEVSPLAHTRTEIITRLKRWHSEHHWHIAAEHFERLVDSELRDPDGLRKQAAALLDAAEVIDYVRTWHEERFAALHPSGKGRRTTVTNDTIASIMVDWNVTPNETAKQLTDRGFVRSVGALRNALAEHLKRAPAVNAVIGPMRVLLHPR